MIDLTTQFNDIYKVAQLARSKGLDPTLEPESEVAADVAERVEKSVGPKGVAQRIRELLLKIPREEVAIKVAEEIALARFPVEGEKAAEQAIRTGAAILDEGITAAPLQGINTVKVKNNLDGTRYLALYFAGPIRSAGGTDMGLIAVVADYVRQIVGLHKYRATEAEAKRFVEELRLYERDVARFQFKISDDEIFNAIMKLPVEIAGVETDPSEVVSYRNLPRIETNRVRGGALRVVNDGLVGRSKKILKIIGKLNIQGWDWLGDLYQPSEEPGEDTRKEFMFMEDIIAGRPIFSSPITPGGFRLRYGRTRITGMSAIGLHPATMAILDDFPATGTQLKIDKPGKAGIVTPVDTVDTPIVKLKDGSVVRIETPEKAKEVRGSVDSILFVGDLLIGFGEFLENNKPLAPPGFNEEWWAQLLRSSIELNSTMSTAEKITGIPQKRLQSFTETPLKVFPSAAESLTISEKLGAPLHPRYTFFWETLSTDDWKTLRNSMTPHADALRNDPSRATVPLETNMKKLLELICIPHTIQSNMILFGENAPVLAACLGLNKTLPENVGTNGLEAARAVAGFPILLKSGAFVGARMGRPEKAKRREMKPVVHCLFPVGIAGGARRNIVEAAKTDIIANVELTRRRCTKCNEITHQNICPKCKIKTELEFVCPRCNKVSPQNQCPTCHVNCVTYDKRTITLKDLWATACNKFQLTEIPDLVKGVKGLTSGQRCPEPLEKGIFRAKYNLSMFKDGTVRFDSTNAPLTHFTSAETGTPIEKLQKLGYETDMNGAPLERPDQLLPIKLQDIILNTSCGDYLVKVANFIDELLTKCYDLPPFYNLKSRDDLVGHLVIGLSPHTSVGIVGRIIGFTSASVCFAHPFWHASKRRDCDGDEDSVTMVLDILINFSKAFLPSRIGGIMDAPLLLTVVMKPSEVARQAFNLESISKLPIEFFNEASKNADPKLLTDLIATVQHNEKEQTVEQIGFTHNIESINEGNHQSAYLQLETMLDKTTAQLTLAERIRAVDAADVARRVLSTHLMRDLMGNMKAFSTQQMRCTKCNSKFRRPPLKGVCPRCGGKISMTVYKGGVEKYLSLACNLVKRYNLGTYSTQRLMIFQEELNSIFQEDETKKAAAAEKEEKRVKEEKKQPSLSDFL